MCSPTLALLLRHRLRQLGIDKDYVVESAGMNADARDRYPMPDEAVKALKIVAETLERNQTVPAAYDPVRARALLVGEAVAHRTRFILEVDTLPTVTHVFSVLTKTRLRAAPHPV
jgi:hypothetical protein